MLKSEVRSLVRQSPLLRGLGVLKKPESMGICFVGKRDMPVFLDQYLHLSPGRFLDADVDGDRLVVLGHHRGKESLTLGQRARVGGSDARLYVVRKETVGADVWVSRRKMHPLLMCDELRLRISSFSWVKGECPLLLGEVVELECKVRHGQSVSRCFVSVDGEVLSVRFVEPQWAVVNGQVLALYRGEVCLGGCVVKRIDF